MKKKHIQLKYKFSKKILLSHLSLALDDALGLDFMSMTLTFKWQPCLLMIDPECLDNDTYDFFGCLKWSSKCVWDDEPNFCKQWMRKIMVDQNIKNISLLIILKDKLSYIKYLLKHE